MVLQVFTDDSGSSAQEPYYVLGGLAAESDAWQLFKGKWDRVLKANDLRYFKMREANLLDGQFSSGWNPARRDVVVYELAEIIACHASMRIAAYVTRTEFDTIMKGAIMNAAEHQDPYSMLFWSIARQVVGKQYRVGDTTPCDLIFDEQGAIGRRALYWWPRWEKWIHPDRKHLLGSPPIFRDDVEVLPLQAADMYAWTLRNSLFGRDEEKWQAQAVQKVLGSIESFEIWWDRERLLGLRANLALNHVAFFEGMGKGS